MGIAILTAVAAESEEAHQGADVRVHQPEGLHRQPLQTVTPAVLIFLTLCMKLMRISTATAARHS